MACCLLAAALFGVMLRTLRRLLGRDPEPAQPWAPAASVAGPSVASDLSVASDPSGVSTSTAERVPAGAS